MNKTWIDAEIYKIQSKIDELEVKLEELFDRYYEEKWVRHEDDYREWMFTED